MSLGVGARLGHYTVTAKLGERHGSYAVSVCSHHEPDCGLAPWPGKAASDGPQLTLRIRIRATGFRQSRTVASKSPTP